MENLQFPETTEIEPSTEAECASDCAETCGVGGGRFGGELCFHAKMEGSAPVLGLVLRGVFR